MQFASISQFANIRARLSKTAAAILPVLEISISQKKACNTHKTYDTRFLGFLALNNTVGPQPPRVTRRLWAPENISLKMVKGTHLPAPASASRGYVKRVKANTISSRSLSDVSLPPRILYVIARI